MKGLSFHVALVHLSSCCVSIDVFLLIVEPGYIMLAAMFLACIVQIVCMQETRIFLGALQLKQLSLIW